MLKLFFSSIYTVKSLVWSLYSMIILTNTWHVWCGSDAMSDKNEINLMPVVKPVILQFSYSKHFPQIYHLAFLLKKMSMASLFVVSWLIVEIFNYLESLIRGRKKKIIVLKNTSEAYLVCEDRYWKTSWILMSTASKLELPGWLLVTQFAWHPWACFAMNFMPLFASKYWLCQWTTAV